jgi:integrase
MFKRLCRRTGVRRNNESRFVPRLHDLRHTFAVHRLTACYREGGDVQRLLPQLATYLGVPFKKSARTVVHYLDKPEMDALLAAAKSKQLTAQGRRDHAMLLFLYNSGARAEEAAQLKIADLHLLSADWNGQAYVQIKGKGGRTRQCPLWPATARELKSLIAKRPPHEHVFLTPSPRAVHTRRHL